MKRLTVHELKSLSYDEAKYELRDRWESRGGLSVSQTDAYTDGFWDARDWVFARLQESLPPEAAEKIGLDLRLFAKCYPEDGDGGQEN